MTAAGEATESRWLEGLDPVTERERRDVTARAVISEGLRSRHFDGHGCGDPRSSGACSNCFGPSPMSAEEIAEVIVDDLRAAGLLTSPDAIARAKAEAWDKGFETARRWNAAPMCQNPYSTTRTNPEETR